MCEKKEPNVEGLLPKRKMLCEMNFNSGTDIMNFIGSEVSIDYQ